VINGFWTIGMSGFGSSSVNGRNRVPRPAAKTNAFVISVMNRKARDSSTSLRMTRRTAEFTATVLVDGNENADFRSIPIG
jgi:hypothetical protein